MPTGGQLARTARAPAMTTDISSVRQKTMLSRFNLRYVILWYTGSRIVLPKGLQLEVLRDHHDSILAGYPSQDYTYHLLARWFYWPRMVQDIASYCNSCDVCQRMKDANRKTYGLLQPLDVPDRSWRSISMDFITDLPKTRADHDSITVFVDRLTKMVHLVAGRTEDSS